MIKLYGFGPAFGLIEASPFVCKVILFMRIHDIKFELIADAAKLSRAPKQKFPYIEDDEEIVADSAFIINHLSKKHQIEMDSWLSNEQRAEAHLISKSLEENLYWCLVSSRWANEDTWPSVRKQFFDSLPFPLDKIVPMVARKGTIKRLNGHGMGSHSVDEVLDIANDSFISLSVLLGDQTFFFGDNVSSLDIVAFAQLSSFTLSSLDNPMNRAAREHRNLVEFSKRIHDKYLQILPPEYAAG